MPKVELAHGIRLDTNYYYWPAELGRRTGPGMFTGSGMPMRFADLDGTLIDVYQARDADDRRVGPDATRSRRHAARPRARAPRATTASFTANMHTDHASTARRRTRSSPPRWRAACRSSRARQMLTWLDGRNASSFGSFAWSGGTCSASRSRPARARTACRRCCPRDVGGRPAHRHDARRVAGHRSRWRRSRASSTRSSPPPPAATRRRYGPTRRRRSSPRSRAPDARRTATSTWTTDEPSDSRVDYGTSARLAHVFGDVAGVTTSHMVT